MAISTLVVGLGGTGLLALRALRRFYDENLEPADRVPTSFLAIDFDRSALQAGDEQNRFADLQEDEFLYLNPAKIQDLLRNLDRAQDGAFAWQAIRDWFPDTDQSPLPISDIEANGARQMRALGRVGFFLNDEAIETSLRRKLNGLANEVDLSTLSNSKRVIILSSLAGGTGAGMLIDLAYVVRRLADKPKIFLYLLLPEVFQDVDTGGRIFQNSYAMLKELAYLKDQQLPFHAEYPGIAPIDVPVGREEPFSRIYLLRGRDGAGSRAIREACVHMARTVLSQLHRVVQEKTLAIVANALSTSGKDEQLRRRTHCFSSAGNALLSLKDLRLSPSAVIEEILRILQEPTRLQQGSDSLVALVQGMHSRPGAEATNEKPALGAIFQEVSISETRDSTEEESAEDVQLPPEARALKREIRGLIGSWRTDLEEKARNCADRILNELKGQNQDPVKEIPQSIPVETMAPPKIPLDQLEARMENIRALSRDLSADEAFVVLEKICPEPIRRFNEKVKAMLAARMPTVEGMGIDDLVRWWRVYRLLAIESLQSPLEEPKWTSDAAILQSFEEHQKRFGKWLADQVSWLRRPFTPRSSLQRQKENAAQSLQNDLRQKLDASFRDRMTKVLAFQAGKLWQGVVGQRSKQADEIMARAREIAALLPRPEAKATALAELPIDIRRKFVGFLGSLLPDVVQKLSSGEPARIKELNVEVVEMVRTRLRRDKELQGARFVLPQDFRDELHRRLVEVRQRVFERRTPNPQRIGFALIFLPTGIITQEDRVNFESMLSAAATMILESRSQVEHYDGRELWIYYEELFNPPDHIWNLDEYFRRYQSEPGKEFFHIDRRFLNESVFRDINSAASGAIALCGNAGCRENIAHVKRGELICPGCGKMIRSRCGNERCHSDEVNLLVKGSPPPRSCPACGEFNHAVWWTCNQHGNLPTYVPIDKERCPECVRLYKNDPHQWPKSCISLRPDLRDALKCPNCLRLHPEGKDDDIFTIPAKLKPFYRKGVNGHDFESFREISRQHGLSEGVRCPKCWTLLIPTHEVYRPKKRCRK